MKKCLCALAAVVAVLVWSAGAFAELTINGDFPNGKVAEWYSSVLSLEGYESARTNDLATTLKLYHWELTKGKLPDGLETEKAGMGILINSDQLAIRLKGRPKKAGTYTFTFRVYDVEDPSNYAEKEFSVIIEENPDLPTPELEGTFPTSGTIGKPYTGTIEAKNGTQPYEWDYDETLLPDGLRMKVLLNNNTKRELSGAPTKNGTYRFTVKVTDTYGKFVSREFSVVIGDDTTPIDPTPVDPTPVDPDPVEPTPTHTSSGGSGGGCDSGFGVLILAALVLKLSR